MKKKKMKKTTKITTIIPNFKLCWVTIRELEFKGRLIYLDHKNLADAVRSAQEATITEGVAAVTITAEMRAVPSKKGRK